MDQAGKCRTRLVFTAQLGLQCHIHLHLQRYFHVFPNSEIIFAFSVSASVCAFAIVEVKEGRGRKPMSAAQALEFAG